MEIKKLYLTYLDSTTTSSKVTRRQFNSNTLRDLGEVMFLHLNNGFMMVDLDTISVAESFQPRPAVSMK